MTTIINGNNTGSVQLTTVQVNTTSTSTTTKRVETFTIGETAYPFMRAKMVTFSAQGLKPRTVYYPFFNNSFVGQYCTTVNSPTITPSGTIQTNQQTLTTDSLGNLVGNFYLPANTFVSGSHEFKLVDNVRVSGGATIADPIYGSAQATYEASGILKQQQTQITQAAVTNHTTVVTPVKPGNITPAPVQTCESWYFEYVVSNSVETQSFKVTTSSATIPANPRPSTGGNNIIPSSITYVGTTQQTTGRSSSRSIQYIHEFRYTAPVNGKTFRQEFVGPKVTDPLTDLPQLTNFKPSGLNSSDIVTIKTGWTRVGAVACPVQFGLKTPKRVDPLAQSFFIDAEKHPNGMFVTAINLYFRTVDQTTPVVVELRDMVNGLPGSNILPGGSVVIPGYTTSQSVDGSVATTARFESPIYLRPSTDYCFVVKSSSLGYNLWCSRFGELDVKTRTVIDAQPFTGTLFKSENDVTWTPDQYEDIKFDLFKADFNTAVTSNLIFRPQKNVATNNYYSTAQTLPLSYISTTKGSKVVGLRIPMHSLADGDKIFIEGIVTPTPVTGYNNILAANLNGEHTITYVDEDIVTITTTGNNANKTGNLIVTDASSGISNIPGVMPVEITLTPAERVINTDQFAPSTVQTAVYSVTQPTAPVVVSSNTFTVYTNIQANEVMIDYLGTEFDHTTITERVSLATGQSTAGAEVPYAFTDFLEIQRDGNFYSFDEPRMLASPRNETLHTTELLGQPSGVVNLRLQSTDKDVSPVIDTNGISIAVRSYKIDNQGDELEGLTDGEFNNSSLNSEILPGTGNAAAKYKSSINVTAEVFNSISLFVTANIPSPAIVDCYVRTSTDRETHMDRNWVWVGSTLERSTDKFVTNEWYFEYNANEPFTVHDVKLVMRSTNNSIVPKIYGVRTITNNL